MGPGLCTRERESWVGGARIRRFARRPRFADSSRKSQRRSCESAHTGKEDPLSCRRKRGGPPGRLRTSQASRLLGPRTRAPPVMHVSP